MKILSHVLEVLTGFVAATLLVGCHTEARQSQDADKASDVEKTETVP